MFFPVYLQCWKAGEGIPTLTFGLKIYPFLYRPSIFVNVLSSVMCKVVTAACGYSGQGFCDLPGGALMCGEHFSPCPFLLFFGLCYFCLLRSATQKNL